MAEIRPLRAVRYEPSAVGSLGRRRRPPYDVIDADMRGEARREEPVQRGRDRPAGRRRRRRPLPARADDLRALASAGHPRPRARGLDLGAHPELRGPRRRAYTRHGFFARVRVEDYGAGPDPPARAHAPRPEGGPPQPHSRDAREPVPDLQPLPRPRGRRLEGARAGTRATSRSTRPATTTAPTTASGGSPTRRRSRRSARSSPTRSS